MCFGNTTIEFVYFFVRLEFPVFTCSCITDPPPLLEAMAEGVRVMPVAKRDIVIAAAMKNPDLFRDIIVLIRDLFI